MPHKHKRKRDDDTSNFDLAPSNRAKPLPSYTKASLFSTDNESSSNKRRKPNASKQKKAQDDTPKAFARLMAWQSAGKKPSGLDDGTSTKSKKKQQRKQAETEANKESTDSSSAKHTSTTPSATNPTPQTSLKILPGETLSNFALRVDQTLSLSSLARSQNPSALPSDLHAKLKKSQRTTKHNKRLQKMQADWRATEAKLRDKEADEADDLEDQREEEDILWAGVRGTRAAKKGKKKGVKGQDDDDDPWKELEKRRREETKQKNLQDVVQAPPVLKKVKSKFKTRDEDFDALDGRPQGGDDEVVVDVGSVPGKVGSLRRREELNATRKAVIEQYRKMNGRRRGVDERLTLSRAIVT